MIVLYNVRYNFNHKKYYFIMSVIQTDFGTSLLWWVLHGNKKIFVHVGLLFWHACIMHAWISMSSFIQSHIYLIISGCGHLYGIIYSDCSIIFKSRPRSQWYLHDGMEGYCVHRTLWKRIQRSSQPRVLSTTSQMAWKPSCVLQWKVFKVQYWALLLNT